LFNFRHNHDWNVLCFKAGVCYLCGTVAMCAGGEDEVDSEVRSNTPAEFPVEQGSTGRDGRADKRAAEDSDIDHVAAKGDEGNHDSLHLECPVR
jgi:hypothetical protein